MDYGSDARATLGTWLAKRLDDVTSVEVLDFAAPRSGYSAETAVFDARVIRGTVSSDEKFVLRMETDEPPVYPAQVSGLGTEIAIQYRAMAAVAASSAIPVAPLIGYEEDPSLLGASFFVMGFIDGDVPVESPSYTKEGFFVEATDAERRTLLFDGLRVLADVHTIDWRAAGLDWLVPEGVSPGIARQLEIWESYTDQELRGRHHPLLEESFAWLNANRPENPSLGMSWGDPRPGNIIWKGFRAACATDWEACSIAPPEMDLGWWLMFDRWSHETMNVNPLPGEPTRQEQVAHYETCLGRRVGDTYWYEVFAAARYATIVVRVMNRRVDRRDLPADHTVWIQNPAADCLAELMDR